MEDNIHNPSETPAGKDTHPIVPATMPALGEQRILNIHETEDGPLTASEITPEFGEPVIVEGVDIVEKLYDYVELLNKATQNQLETDPLVASLEKEGEALARDAQKGEIDQGFYLLKVRDSRIYKFWLNPDNSTPYRTIESFIESRFGKSRATGYRLIKDAQFRLLFAAKGLIDSLPTPGERKKLSQLPRSHWIPAWKEISGLNLEKSQDFKNAVVYYAARNHLPYGRMIPTLSPQGLIMLPPRKPKKTVKEETKQPTQKEKLVTAIATYLPASKVQKLNKKGKCTEKTFVRAFKAHGSRDRRIAKSVVEKNKLILAELANCGVPIDEFLNRVVADGLRQVVAKAMKMSHP